MSASYSAGSRRFAHKKVSVVPSHPDTEHLRSPERLPLVSMDSDQGESAFSWQGRRDLVSRMHDQLDELVAARDQMEQLVRVIVEIGSDLDLDVTLHRVLQAAMELTGARYAALGIRVDGALVSFVHAGIDVETARRLGDLPVGDG